MALSKFISVHPANSCYFSWAMAISGATLPFSFTDPVQETYIVNYVLYFEENRLELEFDINVSLDIPVYKVKGELLAEFAAPSER